MTTETTSGWANSSRPQPLVVRVRSCALHCGYMPTRRLPLIVADRLVYNLVCLQYEQPGVAAVSHQISWSPVFLSWWWWWWWLLSFSFPLALPLMKRLGWRRRLSEALALVPFRGSPSRRCRHLSMHTKHSSSGAGGASEGRRKLTFRDVDGQAYRSHGRRKSFWLEGVDL